MFFFEIINSLDSRFCSMFPKPFVTVSLTRETHLFKSLKRRVDDPLSILRRSCYVVCHTSGAARRMKRIKKLDVL